jgi:glycosyltransferase involved in cell wall biosynthesis
MQQMNVPARMASPAESPTSFSPAAWVTLSVVIPVYNEEQSLRPLYAALTDALERVGQSYEVIFVDDGSTDGSFAVLQELHAGDARICVVRFRRNFGKTPALVAGFTRARGDIIFTMDADLQDDPAEIPQFLERLVEDYDLVSGWKYPRHDPISKTLPSLVFNRVVGLTTGVRIHDMNCGFKAYRRELIDDLKLYGELHRFIPVLAAQRGFRISEVKVRHHPRKYGKSKFGASRFLRGFLDLLMVVFLTTYMRTPLRLFGPLGLLSLLAGIAVDLYVVLDSWLPFGSRQPIHNRPVLFVGILLIIFGISFILTGLQSEMIRHFAYRPGEDYSVRQVLASEEQDGHTRRDGHDGTTRQVGTAGTGTREEQGTRDGMARSGGHSIP